MLGEVVGMYTEYPKTLFQRSAALIGVAENIIVINATERAVTWIVLYISRTVEKRAYLRKVSL